MAVYPFPAPSAAGCCVVVFAALQDPGRGLGEHGTTNHRVQGEEEAWEVLERASPRLAFHGAARVVVLRGALRVAGRVLLEEGGSNGGSGFNSGDLDDDASVVMMRGHRVFSPTSHAAVVLEAVGGIDEHQGQQRAASSASRSRSVSLPSSLPSFCRDVDVISVPGPVVALAAQAADEVTGQNRHLSITAVVVLFPLSPEANDVALIREPLFSARDQVLPQWPKRFATALDEDFAAFGSLPWFQPLHSPESRALGIDLTFPAIWPDHLQTAFTSQQFQTRPVVLVTGRVNVGKSSFVRYLVNLLLNTHDRVRLLETDIGQSEMFVPGSISLHELGAGCNYNSLLGPPFTHIDLQPQAAAFVGSTTAKHDVRDMIRSIVDVVATWEQKNSLDPLPLVINTHGWVTGAGQSIICETIRATQPSLIIQLRAPEEEGGRGDPVVIASWADIERTVVELAEAVATGNDAVPPPLPPLLLLLPSAVGFAAEEQRQLHMRHGVTDPSTSLTKPISSVDARSLQLEFYFGSWREKSLTSVFRSTEPGEWILSRPCVRVPFGDLSVVLLPPIAEVVPTTQVLRVLNASLVALCTGHARGEPEPTGKLRVVHAGSHGSDDLIRHDECLCLGVVRAVDPTERCFYVILPSGSASFVERIRDECNSLVKGQLELPDHFWQSEQAMAPTTTPYFCARALSSADAFAAQGTDPSVAIATQPTTRNPNSRQASSRA